MDKENFSNSYTEFPPLSSETNESGVSVFISKLFKFPKTSSSESSPNAENNMIDDKTSDTSEWRDTKSDNAIETSSNSMDLSEGRSLLNVLKRIRSLVALKSWSGTRYADTELARYWMPDDVAKECYECGLRFTTLRRKHHCRVCGQIFCSRCCSQTVPGQICGCTGGLRVCNYCCKVVFTYIQSTDMGNEISADLRALQENLQGKFPEESNLSQSNTEDNFMLDRQQIVNEIKVSPKEALDDIYKQIFSSLPTQQHRYRLVRYSNVWRGSDILQWLTEHGSESTRVHATSICQSLLNESYINCVTEHQTFTDYVLYKPGKNPFQVLPDEKLIHNLMTGSTSSFCLDLNLEDSSARLVRGLKSDERAYYSPSSDEENGPIVQIENLGNVAPQWCQAVSDSGHEHLKMLMGQCLSREGLPQSWLEILMPLVKQAAEMVTPDWIQNEMDIRNFVQVKKVPGGIPQESHVISGVVMTKNVSHRGMPQKIINPSVLLLDCSIVYQRAEGKLTSLEPVILQEREYLSRCVARISSLRPHVVVARGSAARGAADALRDAGVALALGVRPAALMRLARCLTATPVSSIDAIIATPRLGTCKLFYVHQYESKTLMVTEGCAEPSLGCCILLRGGTINDLIRVKKVTRFMLLAAYNWRLEKSFLGDIGATLPDGQLPFTNGSNDNSPTSSGINENCIDRNLATSAKCDNNTDSSEQDSNKGKSINFKNDPLQSNRSSSSARKTESVDKTLTCGVTISDFSDPLRSKQYSVDDDVFLTPCDLKNIDISDSKWSATDVILSMSPHVRATIPYLETEVGKKNPMRKYFRTPLFPSPLPRSSITQRKNRRKSSRIQDRNELMLDEAHPFVNDAIKNSVEDLDLKTQLASFRAIGGKLKHNVHADDCPAKGRNKKSSDGIAEDQQNWYILDPFSAENHQRLALLFYSFSPRSANAPDYCVNPWILRMEMYRERDLPLQIFLEKYCFNLEYKCPSSSCHTPMMHHIRRFVHGDGCITVTCSTVENSTNLGRSSADDESKQAIMWWCRCVYCSRGTAPPATRLTSDSLRLSLATYLRLRLRAACYIRVTNTSADNANTAQDSQCTHSLFCAHNHYFAQGPTTVCFKYSKIKSWEINLPPSTISTCYNTKEMRDSLINQVNDLVLKGHEIFSSMTEREAESDHLAFKQHMENIQLNLPSASLQNQDSDCGVVRILWSISDGLIIGEKMLRDASEKWSNPPTLKLSSKLPLESTSSVELKPEVDEASPPDFTAIDCSVDIYKTGVAVPSESDHTADEDEDKGDRKSVRAILLQLLSNSQPANQNGMILSDGLIPIVVYPGEIGSVISAALASQHYQQQLQILDVQHSHCIPAEQDDKDSPSPNTKDKPDDKEKSKSNKTNDYIEVQLKDGLFCRVYHPLQFCKLRALFLAPLSSNLNITNHFTPNKTVEGAPVVEGDTNPSDMEKKADVDIQNANNKNFSLKDKLENLKTETTPTSKRSSSKSEGCSKIEYTLTEVEEVFIRSLSRCIAWAAKGGKSGSTFCKTKDERFVLKEMSKFELQLFLEMAPHYFSHVINCHQSKLPTLLARIVGVFRVGGSAGVGGGVLVIENVFYGREANGATGNPLKRFDLKGARRNRLAPDSAQPDAVLMDENLLNLCWESPLYLQYHNAEVLWSAIERDTTFLASHQVMDYSLLLGLDITNYEMTIGIIDYIRTFTWDKKLEHIVKKGLGSGPPTIVSPEQYKIRFFNAMKKYFLQGPSQWDDLHNGLILKNVMSS